MITDKKSIILCCVDVIWVKAPSIKGMIYFLEWKITWTLLLVNDLSRVGNNKRCLIGDTTRIAMWDLKNGDKSSRRFLLEETRIGMICSHLVECKARCSNFNCEITRNIWKRPVRWMNRYMKLELVEWIIWQLYGWQTRFWYDGEVGYVKRQDSNKTIFWHIFKPNLH